MGTTKWLKDLNEGQKGERIIADYLNEKFGLEEIIFNDDYRWDFKGTKASEAIYFEVKTDRYEYFKKDITWNMFIEVSCSGRNSGITTSQADWFIYYYPDHELFYMIKIKDLQELIEKENFRKISQAGDGARVEGYLIHRKQYREYFKVYKIKKDENIWTN